MSVLGIWAIPPRSSSASTRWLDRNIDVPCFASSASIGSMITSIAELPVTTTATDLALANAVPLAGDALHHAAHDHQHQLRMSGQQELERGKVESGQRRVAECAYGRRPWHVQDDGRLAHHLSPPDLTDDHLAAAVAGGAAAGHLQPAGQHEVRGVGLVALLEQCVTGWNVDPLDELAAAVAPTEPPPCRAHRRPSLPPARCAGGDGPRWRHALLGQGGRPAIRRTPAGR